MADTPYAGITRTGSGGLRPLDGPPTIPWRTVDQRTLSLDGPSSRVSVVSDRLTGPGVNAKATGCAARIAGRPAEVGEPPVVGLVFGSAVDLLVGSVIARSSA